MRVLTFQEKNLISGEIILFPVRLQNIQKGSCMSIFNKLYYDLEMDVPVLLSIIPQHVTLPTKASP